VNNPSSFALLVGYPGYIAMQYSLHSVQTLKDKRNEAVSFVEHV